VWDNLDKSMEYVSASLSAIRSNSSYAKCCE
jgi:hypothetical protein